MGVTPGAAPRRFWMELALVLAVFVAGSGLGMAALKARRSSEGQSAVVCPATFLAPPLMIAAGRGPFMPDIAAVPGLSDFLEHKTAAFDPASLPREIPAARDSAAEYHVYLGWTVAVIWRFLGVSWRVLEPFLALGLGLTAVCAYGLFRLGMNRGLSLAGTALFISSPAVLDQLNNMRDFSKAPFLLGGMFAIGWLITRREAPRFLWTAIASMGVLAGAGMGFRQDAMILVPATLVALLILSPGVAYGTRRRRAAAVLVYLAAFLATAAPMLTRMEGGAQPYHPLAQGYSSRHMDRNSLVTGACEPLACSHDNFVFATVFSYARRAMGDRQLYFAYNDPEDARFTRDWVVHTAMQFPADTVARVYGAVLNVFGAADTFTAGLVRHDGWEAFLVETHTRIASFFRLAGLPMALLALLAAAAASPRTAFGLVLLALYFCGYVSLDNEWRHTFHLSFVCFWMAGFLLQQAFHAFRRGFRGMGPWGMRLRRAGFFLTLGTLVLWAPWQLGRVWQRHTLDTLLQQYSALPRSAVPTQAEPMQDWTLFRLKTGSAGADRSAQPDKFDQLRAALKGSAPRAWEADCRLYAVRLRARPAAARFMAKYWAPAGEESHYDFTQLMRVSGAGRNGGETWFFFPVCQLPRRALFEGIAFAPEDAANFLGLYRLDDALLPVLLPCATLNEPGVPARLTANLAVPYDPERFFTPENDPVQMAEAGERAGTLGRLDSAIFYARAANALRPSSEQESKIAFLCDAAGNTEAALRLLKSTVLSSGGDIVSCIALEDFLRQKASDVSAPQVWEELARQTASPGVWQAYERSVGGEDTDRRITVLRQLRQVVPDDQNAALRLQNLLTEKAGQLEAAGDAAGATAVLREAIPLNQNNNAPVLQLQTVLSKGIPEECRSVWEAVWKDSPENPHVAARCGVARAAAGDIAGARTAFDAARAKAPDSWNFCVLAADAMAAAGEWNDAVAAYERALALNPALNYLRERLDEARNRSAQAAKGSQNAPPQAAAP